MRISCSVFFQVLFLDIPRRGGQVARSAGTFGQLVAKQFTFVVIKLPSGKFRLFRKNCWATIGRVSNLDFYNLVKSKAGYNRWLGRRPSVRGSAMNPCEHPLGGGEGRCSIGGIPVSPWGKPALGKKTRKHKLYSDIYLV